MSDRQPSFERVSTIFERVKANVQGRTDAPALPCGIPPLDQAIRGLPQGKVTILAARTTEGKTSLGIQIAANLADCGKTVAYITLEDDRESLVERLYCQMARVDHGRLLAGQLSALEHPAMPRVFEQLRLLVLDNYGYNMRELETVMASLAPPPDVVFVDYAQMIDQAQRETEYEAISRFVRDVKVFAERHRIAVVLLSQINRVGARDGRPQLHHLASCGRLEQVANLVLLLFAPRFYDMASYDYDPTSGRGLKDCPREYVELEIAKNKTGRRNVIVPLRFIGSQYRFEAWHVDQESV